MIQLGQRMRLFTAVSMLWTLMACSGSEGEPLRVAQRSEMPLAPGVVLKVEDIEIDNGARLSVIVDGAPVAQKRVQAGDVIAFDARGSHMEVEVVRLENHVMHEDYLHVLVRRGGR